MTRSQFLGIGLAVLIGYLALSHPSPPPSPHLPAKPAQPDTKPVAPAPSKPDPPCPSWPQQSGGRSASKIVEAGPNNGPDGRRAMIDYPAAIWKENITSRGQGCCVFRSWDFAAHWQYVPALWAFPEWLQKHGLEGGGYSGNVTTRIAAICKERGVPEPEYLNVESNDFALLKLILATGRLALVDYSGADGVHYGGRIAHCVCICYADDDYIAILDNNFPPDKLLWMPVSEFKRRWGGWLMCLLAPRPPAAPWN